jgi:hypothetical protein
MSDLRKLVFGVLVIGATSMGCTEDGSVAGCTDQDFYDQDTPCLTPAECPSCDTVCEANDGTSLGAPFCEMIVGFGQYCGCSCEICAEGTMQ